MLCSQTLTVSSAPMHNAEFVLPDSLLTSTLFLLDLSQDVASKGLGLVYEMGDEADQQTLVSTLVETLMTGKRSVAGLEISAKIIFQHNTKLPFMDFLQTERSMLFLRTQRCSKERVLVKHLMGESFGCHSILLKFRNGQLSHCICFNSVLIQQSLIEFLLLSCSSSHGLTTYKELCSLASDLNQPDLVYKFMNLANHHAMWNSRKVP